MTSQRLTHDAITDIVQRIEPTWTVREATLATAGYHLVYHLDIETGDGSRQCVLKATPPEGDPVCGEEARMLAVLGAHTDLPVPEVLGVVDDDPDLPTPLFLASELPGANDDRTALAEFSDAEIEALGRSTGRHLARLHGLDAVDGYGFVGVDTAGTLDGGRPDAAREAITVEEPTDSWETYVREERDRVLGVLEETRFDDIAPEVEPTLDAYVEDLSGDFWPVLGRIDQSLDNVLTDPDTREVTGLLDWEFCVATTPGYDIEFVAESLSGGHLTLLPEYPDPRDALREAILAGYREAGGEAVVEQFRANRECYELLTHLHAMLNFDPWFDDIDVVDVTDEQRAAAAREARERVRSMIGDGPA